MTGRVARGKLGGGNDCRRTSMKAACLKKDRDIRYFLVGLLAPKSNFGLSRLGLVGEVKFVKVLKEPAGILALGIQGIQGIVALGMQ